MKMEWEDILGSGALLCKRGADYVAGDGSAAAHQGQLVTLALVGRVVATGDEFERDAAFRYRVGDLDVVRGIDLAVRMMALGDAWTIRLQPRLAFAAIGLAPSVPPGADVEYEITLVELADVLLPVEAMPLVLRKARAADRKEAGNAHFRAGRMGAAGTCYSQALRCLTFGKGDGPKDEPLPVADAEWCALFESCSNNMSTVHVRDGERAKARGLGRAVLKVNPDSLKALVHVGTAAVSASDFGEAARTLERALRLRPGFAPAARQLALLKQKRARHAVAERKMSRRMMRGGGGAGTVHGGGGSAAVREAEDGSATPPPATPAATPAAAKAAVSVAEPRAMHSIARWRTPLLAAVAVVLFAIGAKVWSARGTRANITY